MICILQFNFLTIAKFSHRKAMSSSSSYEINMVPMFWFSFPPTNYATKCINRFHILTGRIMFNILWDSFFQYISMFPFLAADPLCWYMSHFLPTFIYLYWYLLGPVRHQLDAQILHCHQFDLPRLSLPVLEALVWQMLVGHGIFPKKSV